MLQSVKRHMPGVDVLQLTDDDTPAIDGCEVVRMPWDGKAPMLYRMRHLAQLSGDVLCIDTDVMLQANLGHVFAFPFDVALTWRDGPILDTNGVDVTKFMPINCGVMFTRERRFWRECVRFCESHNFEDWYADQIAVTKVYPHFDTLRLHCDNFNYTPAHAADSLGRLALHFKGDRKPMMVEYARIEGYLLDTD